MYPVGVGVQGSRAAERVVLGVGEAPVRERSLQEQQRGDRAAGGRADAGQGEGNQPGAEAVPDQVDPDGGRLGVQRGEQRPEPVAADGPGAGLHGGVGEHPQDVFGAVDGLAEPVADALLRTRRSRGAERIGGSLVVRRGVIAQQQRGLAGVLELAVGRGRRRQRPDQLGDLLQPLLFRVVGLGQASRRLSLVDQLADLRDDIGLRWIGESRSQRGGDVGSGQRRGPGAEGDLGAGCLLAERRPAPRGSPGWAGTTATASRCRRSPSLPRPGRPCAAVRIIGNISPYSWPALFCEVPHPWLKANRSVTPAARPPRPGSCPDRAMSAVRSR